MWDKVVPKYPFIFYKQLSFSNTNTLEYISSISTALIDDYCNRKRVGKPLSISNQKRKRIERSASGSKCSEKLQLLAHIPEVVSNRPRCAYCSRKKEKNECDL